MEYLGLNHLPPKIYRLSISPDPISLSNSKGFIDKDERIQTLLSADTKSREVNVYLFSFSKNKRSSKNYRRSLKSHSVEPNFEIRDHDGIEQFHCKLKSKKITLKFFPNSLVYLVSGTYAKEKKVCKHFFS